METKGPMDQYITKPEELRGESSQSTHLQHNAKEELVHVTHSFQWKFLKTVTLRTCTAAGTVENSLQKSRRFKECADANKEKELVIIKDGRAINKHFPCCLIEQDAVLTIQYIKAPENSGKSVGVAAQPQSKMPSDKLVTFNISTRGGKGIRRIMRNLELRNTVDEISVYGYKGETVKRALKRDGRLNNIFTHYELSEKNTEVSIEMNNPVDHLDGKNFQVVCVGESSLPDSQPDSQPGSLDDAYIEPNGSHTSSSDVQQSPPQQSTADESVNTSAAEKTLIVKSCFHEIPNSEKLLSLLRKQFKGLVEQMKAREKVSRLSDVKNLLRVEYGKNQETCREVGMFKKLTELSNSVCQVKINGQAAGSGFLLFDRFVLTNGHVIIDNYDPRSKQFQMPVTVVFSFEDLKDQDSCETVEVESVAAGEYFRDVSGQFRDWALLELCPAERFPDGLIKCFEMVLPRGGICIIGHPGKGVKMLDPCYVIPLDEIDDCIQLVTNTFFQDVVNEVKDNRQLLKYNTCFYYGSSGSPVFDEYCNVVAMHSGGYRYNHESRTPSDIEYGHPLSLIIEQIVIQLVERGKLDVLKEYLTCEHAKQQEVMKNVKKIVDSRNLRAFKKVPEDSEIANDEILKAFFGFFSQKEESVPMDIEQV